MVWKVFDNKTAQVKRKFQKIAENAKEGGKWRQEKCGNCRKITEVGETEETHGISLPISNPPRKKYTLRMSSPGINK